MRRLQRAYRIPIADLCIKTYNEHGLIKGAKVLGIAPDTFNRWLNHLEIKRTASITVPKRPKKAEIEQRFGKPIREILVTALETYGWRGATAHLGVSGKTFSRWLKEEGIEFTRRRAFL